jgi:hypothetical protein
MANQNVNPDNFPIEVSISTHPAHSKEECDYNASRNAWIFQPQYITLRGFVEKILSGHAFCGVFKPNKLKWIRAAGCPDDCFKETQKSYDSYIKTQYIGIDIDDCPLTPQTLMTRISNKPTFWYTTFSNGTKNKFRLIYVLSSPLKENPLVYRYLSTKLGRSLEREAGMGLGIDPVASYTVTQYMNGTDLNADIGYTGLTYSAEKDLGLDFSGLEDFVTNIQAWFPGFDRWKHGKWYNEILYWLKLSNPDLEKYEIPEKGRGVNSEPSKELRYYLARFGSKKFCIHYGNEDKYKGTIQRQTIHPEGDWLGGDPSQGIPGYWRVPDTSDIFIPYPAFKFKDGQHRKKKLFWMTILRRLMTGNNDPDIGFFWLIYDWRRGFTRKDITMKHLVEMIGAVYSRSLSELWEMKKDDVIAWNQKHGNKEVIFKKGDPRSPRTITEYKEWREENIEQLLDTWFDLGKSVTDNIKEIEEKLIKRKFPISFTPSSVTVYKWLKKKHPDWKSPKDKTLKKHESQKDDVLSILKNDEILVINSRKLWALYQERDGIVVKSLRQFQRIISTILKELKQH